MFRCVGLLWIWFLLFVFIPSGEARELIQPGDIFPELSVPAPRAAADRHYLTLDGYRFVPSEVKAELLLVELLNVHCPHCQMQAPAYNELFRLIEAAPETRGKIKILAFAVGNQEKEVEIFRQAYQVPFPILADPQFELWRAIGGGATPLSVYVRQEEPGRAGVVAGTHLGLNTNYQQLYRALRRMTTIAPEDLRRQTLNAQEKLQRRVQPILSTEELEFRVRSALTRFGRIVDFSRLSLLSGRQVYAALLDQTGKKELIFAEVSSRSSVCDICHDVHFFYLFDRSSRILAFEPLQLTKYGNINWDQQDLNAMRKRVVGQYLSRPRPFSPEVDAVSSATITSAIIFDSLAQGEELLKELQLLGLL